MAKNKLFPFIYCPLFSHKKNKILFTKSSVCSMMNRCEGASIMVRQQRTILSEDSL